MLHNPGRAELSGLLCRVTAMGPGAPCRCGWPRPRVGFSGPSLRQSSTVPWFSITVQPPGILLLPVGHGMSCGVENAMPWRVCEQRLLPALCHGHEQPGAGAVSSSFLGATAGAQPREMLSPAFEESAQGLCVCSAFGCQLWFASPQSRLSLACSGARPGEGAGGFGSLGYLERIKPKCKCEEGRA